MSAGSAFRAGARASFAGVGSDGGGPARTVFPSSRAATLLLALTFPVRSVLAVTSTAVEPAIQQPTHEGLGSIAAEKISDSQAIAQFRLGGMPLAATRRRGPDHSKGAARHASPSRYTRCAGRNLCTRQLMRLTTWNCFRGKAPEHCLELLEPLRADLITLQECRRPDGEDTPVIWRGTEPANGTAVVSTLAAVQLESISIPSLHPPVVPVVVHAPQPFVFVGVWTHPPYNEVAWDVMSACVAAADGLPVVGAGDFNSSPGVSGQERDSLQFLERMRNELGLVSAYHHFFGEKPGSETRATLYYQWKESKPFHIDYCFIPEGWVDRLAGVEVGTFAAWHQSDHRPLTVDLKY